MVSVTKFPTVVLNGSAGSTWSNLTAIGSSDGNYAESRNLSGGLIGIFPTTDGVNPDTGGCSYGTTACNIKYAHGDPLGCYPAYGGGNWVVNEVGSDTDTWGLSLTPEIVNSPNFGVVLWPPGTQPLSISGFGFSIPSGNVINGMRVTIRWQAPCGPDMCSSQSLCTYQRIDYVSITLIYGLSSAQCTTGQTYCGSGGSGNHYYTCNNGMWYDNGPNVVACPPGPGTECSAGTKCENGYYFVCSNGYWVNEGLSSICCTPGSTQCSSGHQYTCPSGFWVDGGLSTTCPGNECSGSGTTCNNGHKIQCQNGYLVDIGASADCCIPGTTQCLGGSRSTCQSNGSWGASVIDNTCPGNQCSTGATRCQDGHRINCVNGYEVDAGIDASCPGTQCTGSGTVCDSNDHLIKCENGYNVDLGVSTTCQVNPPPVQNDLSSLLWIVAGVAAVGGGYYLYSRGEKKRASKNGK